MSTSTIRVAAFCGTPAWLYRRVGTASLSRVQFRFRHRNYVHAGCTSTCLQGFSTATGGSPADPRAQPGFESLGLPAWVAQALQAQGFQHPTDVQALAMPALLTGQDAVVAAETGSGKTMAYLAPLLTRTAAPGAVLVICPNAALCEQVVAAAKSLLGRRGGTELALSRWSPLPADVPAVVAATPGTLASLVRATGPDTPGPWSGQGLADWARCVVLDEADMLLGGSYRRDLGILLDLLAGADRREAAHAVSAQLGMPLAEFARLPRHQRRAAETGGVPALRATGWPGTGAQKEEAAGVEGNTSRAASSARRDTPGGESSGSNTPGSTPGLLRRPGGRQYVFVGATLPREGKHEVGAWLRQTFPGAAWLEGPRLHRTPAGAAAAAHDWVPVSDARTRNAALTKLVASAGSGITLVFARDAVVADDTARALQALPASKNTRTQVLRFHARVPAEERESAMTTLRAAPADGPSLVLVATDAAARGLDLPGVTHVVQADFASNAIDFLHRIGRTARAGRSGRVTSLYLPEEAPLVQALQAAIAKDLPVEGAFSRKRSFRKKFKRYGEYIPRGQTPAAKQREA